MTPTDDNDDLRVLLDDAVADVRPRHGLDEIRERTDDSRVRRPWGWGVAGTVVATAATVAAVAMFSMPSVRHGGAGPDHTASTPATPLGVRVYFLGDTGAGPRLFQEDHLTSSSSTDPTLDAVQQAIDGRSHDPDYRTAWPTGTEVDRVDKRDDYLLVGLSGRFDLTRRPKSMSPALARISVQQLVWTAQSNADNGRLPVLFEVDGAVRPTLLGVRERTPVRAASADDVLAPVSIDTPRQSDQSSIPVSSPFRVTGRAAAFEANVQWELKQGDTVVRHGFTTAGQCCTLSPYSFTVSAPPGAYTLVVHDEDASDGEGVGRSEDSKAVLVH
jgi:immunoglobulin-like protein involved in spore germination/sporulation and spore germination protein